jgi:endogenous inhibitor of DNA gyrase (YacG/DUF329 family)
MVSVARLSERREGNNMGTVTIKCPKTGKPLGTGIAADKVSFESSSFENGKAGPCPHCGETHTWSKRDAWVADD